MKDKINKRRWQNNANKTDGRSIFKEKKRGFDEYFLLLCTLKQIIMMMNTSKSAHDGGRQMAGKNAVRQYEDCFLTFQGYSCSRGEAENHYHLKKVFFSAKEDDFIIDQRATLQVVLFMSTFLFVPHFVASKVSLRHF